MTVVPPTEINVIIKLVWNFRQLKRAKLILSKKPSKQPARQTKSHKAGVIALPDSIVYYKGAVSEPGKSGTGGTRRRAVGQKGAPRAKSVHTHITVFSEDNCFINGASDTQTEDTLDPPSCHL